MRFLFLAHVASTLILVGVIWIVQVVHYPLFAGVSSQGFASYAARHANLISLVVGPLMLAEAGTGLFLLTARPAFLSQTEAWIGIVMVAAIWAATFVFSVPQHNVLQRGFDQRALDMLVATNWIRTALWTVRGALVLIWLDRALGG